MKRRFKGLKKSESFISVINENNILIFMVFALILGLLIGVMTFKLKNGGGNFFVEEFEKWLSPLKGNFVKIFSASILKLMPFVATIFIFGTCMAGSIITPLIIAIRGAQLGYIMSYLYIHFSLNGIVFNILIIIPSAVLTSIALILSGREAFGFSLSLARLAIPESKSVVLDKDFKVYCMRQIFILAFYMLGAAIEALMAVSFYSFFKLGG